MNFQCIDNRVVQRNGCVCRLCFAQMRCSTIQWTTLHTVQDTGLRQGTILRSVHSLVMAGFSTGYERTNRLRDLRNDAEV